VTTRATLAADIDGWLARSDLSERASSFIRIAEAVIARKVRVRRQVKTVTLSVDSGTATLPEDYIETVALADVSNERRLEYLTPTELHARKYTSDTSGYHFTIESETLIVAGDATLDVRLVYYSRFSALLEASDTNWLLENAYDIYLWLVLSAASDYVSDGEMSASFMQKAMLAIDELRRSEVRSGLSDLVANRSVSAPRRFV